MLTELVAISLLMLATGVMGVLINSHNVIRMLVCIEVMLLGANTLLIVFANALQDLNGQLFVFFVLAIAAAEAAIGLALVIRMHQTRNSIDPNEFKELKY